MSVVRNLVDSPWLRRMCLVDPCALLARSQRCQCFGTNAGAELSIGRLRGPCALLARCLRGPSATSVAREPFS